MKPATPIAWIYSLSNLKIKLPATIKARAIAT